MNAMVLMIGSLCVLAIAYRYYSAFIAAKVATLDDLRQTPAHTMTDGQNYYPTNKWVLFGHHFAAISGAGPLIGPVLAAQFGYLPGLLWILIGVALGGAVQDFIVLSLSIRRGGKSLAQIAYMEVGGMSGTAATIGILFVLVIALAGLGRVVVETLSYKEVHYPAGTQFVAPKFVPLVGSPMYDNVSQYTIEPGTTIIYPVAPGTHGAGETQTAADRFDITCRPEDPLQGAPELDISARTHKAGGSILQVPPGVIAIRHITGSTWGTFTLFLTIPIALFIGLYMYRIRKGKVLEASIVGGLLTLGAVYLGSHLDPSAVDPMTGQPLHFLAFYRPYFDLSDRGVALAMAIYGFFASVLPVWVLLCPRDYLSSFLKLGTLGLLVLGIIVAHPTLHAPALNHTFLAGGPIVPGAVFPFVFITIMCGAISGFHALVSSGTTPKMISKESDARMIGYGAMLTEGLVAIVALIAACSLPSAQYYDMNTALSDMPRYQQQIADLARHDPSTETLTDREHEMHESLHGRTGGAVTLAVGMATIFDGAAKNVLGTSAATLQRIEEFMPYWYHFAIMFEALFILTTIDTGTRIGRFLLQEIFGKLRPAWGRPGWWPGAILATTLMVGGWYYFILSNSMASIWPMFGVANQMLAVMALAIASAALVRGGKARYMWVTLAPMIFVSITTTTAAIEMLAARITTLRTIPAHSAPWTNALISGLLIVVILLCTAIIVVGSLRQIIITTGTRKVEVSRV